jgi:hypothetical protein
VETDCGTNDSAARGKEPKGVGLRHLAYWDWEFEMLCVVRHKSLLRADQSARGVLLSMVCLSVIVKPWKWWSSKDCTRHKKRNLNRTVYTCARFYDWKSWGVNDE